MGDREFIHIFSKTCRACMDTKSKEMVFLSSVHAEMFTLCTDITVSQDDRLPQQICTNCSDLISNMITFRQQCTTSDAMLRKFLETDNEDLLKLDNEKTDVKIEEDQVCGVLKEDTSGIDTSISKDYSFTYGAKVVVNDYNDNGYGDIDDMYQDDDDLPLIDVLKTNRFKLQRKRKHRSKRKMLRNKQKEKEPKQNSVLAVSLEKFDCGLCKIDFDAYNDLALHLEDHKSETICKICDEHCIDWPHLLTHSQEHVKRKVFICYICRKRIVSFQAIEFHIRVKHLGEKGIKCKLCNRAFTTLRYLKKHMVVHSDLKPFACSQCPKRFKTMQLLRNHQRMHDNEKKYICEECGFSCNFSTGLRCHIERKHNIGVYTCSICSKELTNKETLADHERSHKRQYVCAECGKSYNRMGMARHARMHTKERPYACDFCPARFGAASTLANHRRRHTGERPYQCKTCSSAFHTQNVLIKHTRIHTGEKPYVCWVCGKAFTGSHNLKVHMRVHGENIILKKKPQTSEEDSS